MENKNIILRIGIIAAFLAIVSLIVLSYTFAKYTTEYTNSSNTARVAKGGVEISSKSSPSNPMFKTEYVKGGSGEEYVYVKSSLDDNVIAPGTSNKVTLGDMLDLTGAPEVNTKVTFESVTVSFPDDIGKDEDGDWYFPLNFNIGLQGGSASISGMLYDNLVDLNNLFVYRFRQLSSGNGIVLPAGTNLSESDVLDYYWLSGEGPLYLDDDCDTYIGNIAAETTSTDPNLEITIKIKIEQTMDEPTDLDPLDS